MLLLKIKFFADSIRRGREIILIFMGRQNIVIYWDFSNWNKKLVPKTAWHYYWEMFVNMSSGYRVVCFADFVGMTLLAVLFLLPLPICVLRVCLPIFLPAVLNFFKTNNLCNFWRCNFQQVSTYAFCSWDDIFT